jgi:hypothetical protein
MEKLTDFILLVLMIYRLVFKFLPASLRSRRMSKKPLAEEEKRSKARDFVKLLQLAPRTFTVMQKICPRRPKTIIGLKKHMELQLVSSAMELCLELIWAVLIVKLLAIKSAKMRYQQSVRILVYML